MRKLTLGLSIILLLLCTSVMADARPVRNKTNTYSPYKLALGLKTVSLLGDNLNTSTMHFKKESLVSGASFDGLQPGIELKLTYYFDKEETFRLPLWVGYNFFRANETTRGLTANTLSKYHHAVDVLTIGTGLHYAFLNIPLARTKIYAGLELLSTNLLNPEYVYVSENIGGVVGRKEQKLAHKDGVWRMGGLVKLGIEGQLKDPISLNISVGVGALNFIGRDDDRGELFTFDNLHELKESVAYIVDFSLLFQYRF